MSRRKSAPDKTAAKAPARGAGRSPSKSAGTAAGRGVFVQKPRNDIFVVMLGIALASILLACLFLFLVWNRYDRNIKAAAVSPATPVLTALA